MMCVGIPPVVAVQYAHVRKDDLWWKNGLPTDPDLVTQHNGGSSMLVAGALRWTIRGGRTSGGSTLGGENNHALYLRVITGQYKTAVNHKLQ